MMKDSLNEFYEKIVNYLNISEEMFNLAEKEYSNLGDWLNKNSQDYQISIYPQGSIALGTIIKPITDEEQYDLDVVCEFSESHNLSAKKLKKDVVGALLDNYINKFMTLEEKKRCWHIEYSSDQNFHIDVIPAVSKDSYIEITNHNEDTDTYDYIGSNPKAYIRWFNEKKSLIHKALLESYSRNSFLEHAEIKPIDESKIKSPLQKAIQILKRHRDIMFMDNPEDKPISIIITTIAADIYQNEDNIADTLSSFLNITQSYIESKKQGNDFYIVNPTNTGEKKENFADKWNESPEKAENFFNWLDNAKDFFANSDINNLSELERLSHFSIALGDKTIKSIFPENNELSVFLEKEIYENDTAQNVQTIYNAPHRKIPESFGALPKGVRIFIQAKAELPTGKILSLKSDGIKLPKTSKVIFTSVYGGKVKNCKVQWQITNYGSNVPPDHLRGTFEASKTGRTITETCLYTGYHGVQCYITKGNSKILYKSNIFIVNIE